MIPERLLQSVQLNDLQHIAQQIETKGFIGYRETVGAAVQGEKALRKHGRYGRLGLVNHHLHKEHQRLKGVVADLSTEKLRKLIIEEEEGMAKLMRLLRNAIKQRETESKTEARPTRPRPSSKRAACRTGRRWVGISWDSTKSRWRAEGIVEGKRHFFGYFRDPGKAAAVRAEKMKKLYGRRGRGIWWNKRDDKWYAEIKRNGKRQHVGCFRLLWNAVEAREERLKNLPP